MIQGVNDFENESHKRICQLGHPKTPYFNVKDYFMGGYPYPYALIFYNDVYNDNFNDNYFFIKLSLKGQHCNIATFQYFKNDLHGRHGHRPPGSGDPFRANVHRSNIPKSFLKI